MTVPRTFNSAGGSASKRHRSPRSKGKGKHELEVGSMLGTPWPAVSVSVTSASTAGAESEQMQSFPTSRGLVSRPVRFA